MRAKIDARRVGPVSLHRDDAEAMLLDQPARDRRPFPTPSQRVLPENAVRRMRFLPDGGTAIRERRFDSADSGNLARRNSYFMVRQPQHCEETAMNITRWEPFREMEDALRMFSPFSGRALRNDWRNDMERAGHSWRPVANVSETDREYIIKAELPEVRKEDIDITLADGVITIRGERKYEKEHGEADDLRVESFYGTFSRSFSLPDNVDANKIAADCKDGMLRVRIPKMEAHKAQPVSIKVQ